jgi:hypothetical protein
MILTPYLYGAAAVAFGSVVLFGGVQTLRLNHAKADLVTARAQAQTNLNAYKASEAFRERDQQAATASYAALSTTCTADYQQALRAGRTIERVINVPAKADGTRALIPASVLRGLVEQ